MTGNALRDVLRTLTGDPDLDVYYRLPHREEYVTSAGEPAPGRDRIGANADRQLIGAGTVDEQGFTAERRQIRHRTGDPGGCDRAAC